MYLAFLAALGVGGATVFGVVVGFLFRNAAKRYGDLVLSFAAGVMLTAAFCGLLLPALSTGEHALPLGMAGIILGVLCLLPLERLAERLSPTAGEKERSVAIFVLAIAIHNLPEGLAAGVGFGTGEVASALVIAGGIALQNIPEGMVIVAPMLAAGARVRRTFFVAVMTGVIEIVGTLVGYFAVRLVSAILPFALGFAGGMMLFVIVDEMIPQTQNAARGKGVTLAFFFGFCLMLSITSLL